MVTKLPRIDMCVSATCTTSGTILTMANYHPEMSIPNIRTDLTL